MRSHRWACALMKSGMNGLLGAERSAGQLDGPVGDDLVDVHVRLGAAAGLPDAEGEVVVELALRHFRGGLGDPTRLVFGEKAELGIGRAHAFLSRPNAWMSGAGMRSWEMSKW